VGQLTARGVFQPLTDEAGFLRTGDVGNLDRQGRIHLRGRMTAFLKVNGHRVNPFELEPALRALPGVQEAVVVGPPDPVSGQRIVACLEPQPGHTLADIAALTAFCRAQLAPYKVPHRFFVYEKLPRTPAGKPDRGRILKEMSS
jgi:acyl-coenzyme A synthetase/AMP-(fatty) acid ligase